MALHLGHQSGIDQMESLTYVEFPGENTFVIYLW
jgi:hypothetical protein